MRKRFPDTRFRKVEACLAIQSIPENPLEADLYALLIGKPATNPAVEYAFEIASSTYEKQIFDAFILAGATNEQLKQHLRVPSDVCEVYKYLYFDVSQFRDELDLFSWVNEQEQIKGQNSENRVHLLKQAVVGGLDSLIWIYSRNKVELNPQDVLENILADSYYRAKANRFAPLTSKMAKESQAYMSTALKAGDLLVRQNVQQASNTVPDLFIKLGHRELTQPVTALPDPKNLLH